MSASDFLDGWQIPVAFILNNNNDEGPKFSVYMFFFSNLIDLPLLGIFYYALSIYPLGKARACLNLHRVKLKKWCAVPDHLKFLVVSSLI